jgi:hypothetical protein
VKRIAQQKLKTAWKIHAVFCVDDLAGKGFFYSVNVEGKWRALARPA